MRVLFDLNVVLDLLLDRAPWCEQAKPLLSKVLDGTVGGCVSANSIATLYYIARKLVGRDQALVAVNRCLDAFEVAPVGRAVIEAALRYHGSDFEDDIQAACASAIGADVIVTRDDAGFAKSPVPARSAAQVVGMLSGA